MSGWQVFARDSALNLLGPVDTFTRLDLRPRLDVPGTWEMALDAGSAQAGLLGPGRGIGVWAPGLTPGVHPPTLSGLCRSYSQAPRQAPERGVELTWRGPDDWWLLSTRLCLPSPLAADDAQGGYYTTSGAPETMLKQLVDRNLGPGARADRVRPLFTIAPDQGRGRARPTTQLRYANLGNAVSAIAGSGLLNCTVTWDPRARVFLLDAVPRRDLSAAVQLSQQLGNVTGYSLSQAAPTATAVLVAGQGQLAARTIVTATRPDTMWGGERVEVFQDRRDTDDAAALATAAQDTLDAAAASGSMSLTAADVPGMTFGVDYRLGDLVTAEVAGVRVVDSVRAVNITIASDGPVSVVPFVGPTGDNADELASTRLLLSLLQRVGYLERST